MPEAPTLFGIRYTSVGLLLYENNSPSIESSGEICASFEPVMPVILVRAPPSRDIE